MMLCIQGKENEYARLEIHITYKPNFNLYSHFFFIDIFISLANYHAIKHVFCFLLLLNFLLEDYMILQSFVA